MSIIGLWDYNDYPFNIFDVRCNGNETSLLDCHYKTTSSTLCYSYDAVGVFCQKGNNMQFLFKQWSFIDWFIR